MCTQTAAPWVGNIVAGVYNVDAVVGKPLIDTVS